MRNYKELLSNPFLLCQELNERPHTYDTLLREDSRDITQITKLQKKLNKLFRQGKVRKTSVGGVSRGKVIYYGIKKNYDLIIAFNRTGTKIFYCDYYQEINQYAIKLMNCKMLNVARWINIDDRKIIRDNIKKWH